MAQVFKGFTPQQTEVLARKMGYKGEMSAFPGYLKDDKDMAATFKGYHDKAQKRTSQRNFNRGGAALAETINTTDSTQEITENVQNSSIYETTQDMMENPSEYAPDVDAARVAVNTNQFVSPTSGQVAARPDVTAQTVGTAETASAPTETPAPTVTTATTANNVETATGNMEAAQGTLSTEALAQAQTMDPNNLAQLGYSAEQIAEAQKVVSPAARTLEAGEVVSGSAVDMAAVNEALDVTAATANPTEKATVAGQLEGLMSQFDNGQTPPWAAGAMRAAQTMLISRGLGASSIAGQAVIQAAMESALPIAQADAATWAGFEMQNLSNKQQTTMFAAQQRATFLGMKFDQDFQSKVLNASKISEIANLNFTAEQQIALENARMAQSVDLANLDAKSAVLLSNLAALSQLDMTNLNNRQQSAVLNAQSFLQMDMANFDATQQTEMFKQQSIIQSLFTDAAAENANRQFNATSQMQTDQFFANLASQVSQFNAAQKNAMSQFDTEQVNSVAMFNRQLNDQRDQFNASNRLIVDQSNAQWRREIATAETAYQHEANMFEAQAELGLTTAAYNNLMQIERDLYSFAYESSERSADRALQLVLGKMQSKAAGGGGFGEALGTLAGSIINRIFG